jgi:hypothetical protein
MYVALQVPFSYLLTEGKETYVLCRGTIFQENLSSGSRENNFNVLNNVV